VVGRIGDSRLLVICPETSSGEGAIEAERVKNIMAQARFTQVGLNVTITCSFGVASYPEHADSPEDLFCSALDAIEQAVEKGGNRVTVAEFPTSMEPTEDFSPEPKPQQVLPKKPEMAPDLAFPVADVSSIVVP
jgi:predicted signal transduction protein with EAL and GGDEF domain